MKKALAVTAAALLFTGVAQAQKITEESQIVMKNIKIHTFLILGRTGAIKSAAVAADKDYTKVHCGSIVTHTK